MNKILLKIFIIDKDLNEDNIKNYNKSLCNYYDKRIEVRKCK